MARDNMRDKIFSRRALFLIGAKTVLFGALAARMHYLQVIESDQYKVLAEDNRINFRLLAPPRGRIVDRFGVDLASNQQNYRVVLIPEQTRSAETTLARLAELIDIPEHDRRRIMRDVKRMRGFVPVTISENLTWEQFSRINVRSPDLPGIQPDVGETRAYPSNSAFSHVIGYVAPVAEEDKRGSDDPLLQVPGFRVGKSGIERIYDQRLRGTAGSSRVEVNAYGRVIRELGRRDGQPGEMVQLSIDAGLQLLAVERLGEESGGLAVMNVHDGDVLALVSTPAFDPTAFNVGLSRAEWQSLVQNQRNPLVNKSIAGQYPPGSTFKLVVALAALESGLVSPDHSVSCPGFMDLGDHRFHCWKKEGHGRIDFTRGIEQSCDVFFYDLGRRLGPDRIAAMAKKFGLGTKLGVDQTGEKEGLIPTRDWKLAATGVPWQHGETLNTAIGQGFVLATPLQLCVMAARIANGGHVVAPRLLRERGQPSDQKLESIGVSSASLKFVQNAMFGVCNRPHGTAFKARIKEPNLLLAGKTGTSQVRRISKSERLAGKKIKDENKPWHERDHAVFVGYAPANAPRFAAAVVVEHGGAGSAMAAPIIRDVLRLAQLRNPSTGSEPAVAATAPNRES